MIYLARHGETEYNAKKWLNGQHDDPLTYKGKKQAEELARKCLDQNLRVDSICSSPLIRAFVTARIVADILGIKKITVYRNLMERDFGKMTHRPYSMITQMSESDDEILFARKDSIFFLFGQDAETFPELIQRVRPVYDELVYSSYRPECERILVVSHGDVMKAFETLHRKINFIDVLKEGHYENCQIVPLL